MNRTVKLIIPALLTLALVTSVVCIGAADADDADTGGGRHNSGAD